MLSSETVTTPRPRPPAQNRRASASKTLAQASPPPPYASAIPLIPERDRKPSYLGSPLPATLQSLRLSSEGSSPGADEDSSFDQSWLNEKSREELAELLLKADDLIKERETELGVTSAVCKTLYESNVTLKNKHDALVARIPATPPRQSPPLTGNVPFPGAMHSQDNSFDGNNSAAFLRPSRPRRISVSPRDISLLADQNAELLQKLESLESEALTADRTGRRALKQLEREIQLLRDELERTQARSEELEKNAQAGTEKIVEEMWRKKKEREAKFRAMRNNTSPGRGGGVLDFAPAGPFTKNSLSPSNSAEFPSIPFPDDDSYDSEHPDQHVLVSQLLAKIQELEETNTKIIEQQSETADKLHAVQRETESMSKVYEYFNPENGVEWDLVGEDGRKSPMEGTIRFRSFRRTLEAAQVQDDGFASLLTLPTKPRKSVLNLFGGSEPGPSKLSTFHSSSDSTSSTSELSPLRYDLTSRSSTPYNMSPVPGAHPSLQSELGSDFGDDADPFIRSRHDSLYDFSFAVSPAPTPNNLSLRSRVSEARLTRAHSTPAPETPAATNALQLNVEPPTPAGGTLGKKNKERYNKMSQTLLRRTSRWVDGRFSTSSSSDSGTIGAQSTPRPSLPQRLSSAFDLVMDNFAGPGTPPVGTHSAEVSAASATVGSDEAEVEGGGGEATVVLSTAAVSEPTPEKKKAMIVRFILEVWLWLQFGIIILVFLWAMAKRGPKSVLGEADKRAVVRRR
ncbi:hypothetical protein R3P38DRAFT_687189 [Favolaschia claudopus]|uniref:Uncharacterized protein n=1 Tax=Favolaschia claudopus TaxID=2862362 RepID=A0AAW0EAZ7_9AGAR